MSILFFNLKLISHQLHFLRSCDRMDNLSLEFLIRLPSLIVQKINYEDDYTENKGSWTDRNGCSYCFIPNQPVLINLK